MKLLITISIVIGVSVVTTSGQSFDVDLSAKHIQEIENAKTPALKLKKYRKFYKKDSIKQIKDWERSVRHKPDSLLMAKKAKLASARSNLQNTPNGIHLPDSLQSGPLISTSAMNGLQGPQTPGLPTAELPNVEGQLNDLKDKTKKDALSKLNGVSELQDAKKLKGKVGKYSRDISKYRHLDNPDSLKRLAKAKAKELVEDEVKSKMKDMKDFQSYQKELKDARNLKEQYGGQASQLKDSAYFRKQAQERAEKEAMKYLDDHPNIMKPIQQRMNRLMARYSVVPNSNDLSTAIRKTSLKGKTLKERLVVATNFQIVSLIPVTIEFSPMLGYKFNRRFALGVGGNYRHAFGKSVPTSTPTEVLGYKAFSTYDLVKNFFVYAEFARNSPGVLHQDNQTTRIWKNAWIAGLGKTFSISHKIDMTLLFGYHFGHRNGDPIYPSPWIIRVGFQLSELATMSRLHVSH